MNINSTKTILVTGGAGFIGSHTSLVLLEKGYNIIVVDSLVNSSINSLKNVKKLLNDKNLRTDEQIEFYKIDLRKKKDLENIFYDARSKNKKIEAVIHFAGLKSVSESLSNPLEYWSANFLGSLNLIEIMNKFSCKTIVFSSSASIYGLSNRKSIPENNLINPISPYGETKAAIERFLANIFYSSKEWKIANLRYFNPIGSHESGLLGEDPKSIPNNIYPRILGVSTGKFKEIQIFGKDWPTKDGTAIRDYIHVMDVAEAHLSVLEYLFEEKNQILNLNIGTGKPTTVFELINTFQKVNHIKIPYSFSSRRKGDYGLVVADISLITKLVNWKAKRSLEQMCKDGWNWQKKYPNGYIQ